MDKKYGASKVINSENQRQRKIKRAKRREDRRKYGWNKQTRAENKAEAATKRKALAQMAIVGGDAKAGYSKGDDGNFSYTGSDSSTDFGAPMHGNGKKKGAMKGATAGIKAGAQAAAKKAAMEGAAEGAKQMFRGRKYDNVEVFNEMIGGKPNMSVPAEKLKYIQKSDGPSMYGKKHHGSSMNAYQDKEASMDDYSHEKKLKADGRYEAAHGKMANAENDFDHAHALKKDAHHDARSRISILKHMKKF